MRKLTELRITECLNLSDDEGSDRIGVMHTHAHESDLASGYRFRSVVHVLISGRLIGCVNTVIDCLCKQAL